jgi:ketosteroid isomerase-like protein
MPTSVEVREAIRRKVERVSDLLFQCDPRVVDEIWSPGLRLVGSERGEIAEDRNRLVKLFDMLFARAARHAMRYAFDFPKFEVESIGDVAWLFAEGDVTETTLQGVTRRPYRLTAVFEHDDEGWRWRLYSGSEPGSPRE